VTSAATGLRVEAFLVLGQCLLSWTEWECSLVSVCCAASYGVKDANSC
jgi:hypothetical protein